MRILNQTKLHVWQGSLTSLTRKTLFFESQVAHQKYPRCHQNITGFVSIQNILEVTIADLSYSDNRPDNFTNYNIDASYCRRNGSKSSGVCILTRKGNEIRDKTFCSGYLNVALCTYIT